MTVYEYRLDLHYRQLQTMAEAADTAPEPYHVQQGAIDAYAGHGALAEALWRQPDLVLAVSGGNLHFTVPLTLRKYGLRTAVYLTECPYQMPMERSIAALYDVVFTHERNAVSLFDHPRVHYLPHAYNARLHTRGPYHAEKQCDVFFVGSGFSERRALFDGVAWDGISFVRKGFLWDAEEDARAHDLCNPPGILPNEEAVWWYRSARINLNHHRTTTIYGDGAHIPDGAAASLGPRAYEIAACGGFQISDASRPELEDVFGGTVPTYRLHDSADLERQIRYYLAHPDDRERLRRAQYDAVQPHSWDARSRTLLDIARTT